jgi:spermidine synthase
LAVAEFAEIQHAYLFSEFLQFEAQRRVRMARKGKLRRVPTQRDAGELPPPVELRPLIFSQSAGLKVLVFTAGAVLMGLEIAGSRVLTPHFGNSVFVWGSLISVFLIALSVGYYLGGKLADRRPSQRLLNSICVAVSAWIFLLAAIGHPVCEGLFQAGLGEQSGPLLASAVLFLPPSVALGMVSPFSIRIAATGISSLGQVSGTLYALSTAGSIVGTLLTTFVLIPLIGVTAILRILGLAMLLISVITLPIAKGSWGGAALPLALTILVGGLFLSGQDSIGLLPAETIVRDEETPYHRILVIDNSQYGIRQLRFDRQVESGIFLREPYPTSEKYTQYFQLAFLARPRMNRVLFIGAGGGIGPRAFAAHDPKLEIDVVDIDQRVLEVAKEFFFLRESPSMKLFAQDGRMFLRQSAAEYDCIVLDAFTIGGRIPFHLVTREFLELCRDRLAPDGIFLMNMGSALNGPRGRIFRSMHRTADSVFRNIYVFAEDSRLAGTLLSTNSILIGSRDPQRIAEERWIARAEGFQSAGNIGAPEMKKMVSDFIASAEPDETAPVFTDDYAPIETMAF